MNSGGRPRSGTATRCRDLRSRMDTRAHPPQQLHCFQQLAQNYFIKSLKVIPGRTDIKGMRIEASAIAMSAAHRVENSYLKEEKLEAWINAPAANSTGIVDTVSLSIDTATDKCGDALLYTEENLPKELLLLIRFIEQITGKKFRFLKIDADFQTSGQTGTGGIPTDWGVRYDYHEIKAESEQTAFSAQGIVRTADGREIAFNLNLTMSRAFMEETHLSVLAGPPRKAVDPLVINFDGGTAELTDWSFDFDLDADGKTEAIPFVTQGSGLLVFDRNGDGVVNNGSELFGPLTGNGFAELAGLDQDGNGWIDENDAAYARLAVWIRSADGPGKLLSLQQSGIGALNTGYVESPFDLKDQSNASRGQIVRTGIYLAQSGQAGTIQQLDLFV